MHRDPVNGPEEFSVLRLLVERFEERKFIWMCIGHIKPVRIDTFDMPMNGLELQETLKRFRLHCEIEHPGSVL